MNPHFQDFIRLISAGKYTVDACEYDAQSGMNNIQISTEDGSALSIEQMGYCEEKDKPMVAIFHNDDSDGDEEVPIHFDRYTSADGTEISIGIHIENTEAYIGIILVKVYRVKVISTPKVKAQVHESKD